MTRKKSPPLKEILKARGIIRMHPRGFAFVTPDDHSSLEEEIFIPKHLTCDAVDLDLVEVAVDLKLRSEKGIEGAVISILKRAREQLVGTIDRVADKEISAYVPILGEGREVLIKQNGDIPLEVGDRVVLTIVDWGEQKGAMWCVPLKKLGHISDPSCDVAIASIEYGLTPHFPKKVVEQAQAFGKQVGKKELANRLDLTKTTSITIDPDTAKDFDDALSIERDKQGHFFLGIHIADVAHYVAQNSPLDLEASVRSNSTYFPGSCLPMLPEELSNHLCSLRQGVIRLTVSVLVEFDPNGNVLRAEVRRSYIKSRKRLTYGEARQILDGKLKSPYAKPLQHMVELCHLLKKKRQQRGSIDFALPELIVLLDELGSPTGVKIEEYDITHQLVEEFMLKANELVASYLTVQGKKQLFRIHEEPSTENLENFFAIARGLGFPLPPKPSQEDIQKLFQSAKDTPFSQQLAINFIRTLKLAYYSPRNVGHYGLALENYCHFTSPIRRYSDLVTQRLLFDQQSKEVSLEKIGQSCSEKERVSFRAEMSVKLLKKYRLLHRWFLEDPTRAYPAFITRIKPFGFFFEIKELFLEGFLHISNLDNDYFLYDQAGPMLVGERSGKKYALAELCSVRPSSIDLIHMSAKWELILPTEKRRKGHR